MLYLDEYIINKIQEYYTKIWNRLGLTVGVLCAIFRSVVLLNFSLFVFFIDSNFIKFISTLVIISFIISIYTDLRLHSEQLAGNYKKINSRAENARNCGSKHIRLFFAILMTIVLLQSLLTNSITSVVCLAYVLAFYLETTYVKDRDPPELSKYASSSV